MSHHGNGLAYKCSSSVRTCSGLKCAGIEQSTACDSAGVAIRENHPGAQRKWGSSKNECGADGPGLS
jgi:hypothetical protein